jgi:hypothetical protein
MGEWGIGEWLMRNGGTGGSLAVVGGGAVVAAGVAAEVGEEDWLNGEWVNGEWVNGEWVNGEWGMGNGGIGQAASIEAAHGLLRVVRATALGWRAGGSSGRSRAS